MNKLFALFLLLSIAACQSPSKDLPKIAIAGLAIESSTFSPATSDVSSFKAREGEEIFKRYSFMQPDSGILERANWVPTLQGHSIPGGAVTKEAYEFLVGKTLEKLEAGKPYDGLFFDIHGAMSVVGMDDPEGDFIKRVREVVGYETVISTSMDLHGNVSETLARETDLITCYRLAPHEDATESRKRALVNLIERLESGKGKPKHKAWIPVPILLPGEKTSTRIEPAKSLYAKVDPLTKKDGVIDAAIWVGYPWADEPRNHAVVMATGDSKEEVGKAAEELATYFWSVRNEFRFVAPTTTFEDALAQALASDKKPFIMSDMGDNPTAGGAGDVTWTLQELLKQPEFQNENGPALIYASLPGPDFVEKAMTAGIGNIAEGFAGAEVDDRFAPPLKLKGVVKAIKEGDRDAGVEVVVKIGSISAIVTQKRKPYHQESDFKDLDLNPRESDIVVVKIGYLVPELYNMRGDWVMALTPGGVDQNIEGLEYTRIKRPMFPFDKNMEIPDLSARFIAGSGE